ncbi:MAG: crossover junction endodeoxyribonuclease RuvC [Myxococcales bacterium]|nr:crossover junction endodeoxyribonuclease RuvC [Myxococcales bacterium]
MRVLGIDPGSRLCGWAVVDGQGPNLTHIDNGVFVLGDERVALPTRLDRLFAALERVIAEHRPAVVSVEKVFMGHGNPQSALALGHARGVALLAAARAGLPVHAYTAQEVKKAMTGSGRAGKHQVQQMVALRFGLPEVPQEDAADAVAVAVCHAQHLAAPAPSVPRPPPARQRGRSALTAWVEAQKKEPS